MRALQRLSEDTVHLASIAGFAEDGISALEIPPRHQDDHPSRGFHFHLLSDLKTGHRSHDPVADGEFVVTAAHVLEYLCGAVHRLNAVVLIQRTRYLVIDDVDV